MNSKIGIVTVLYNSESVLEMFYEALSKQTHKDFILYIVDNKSPDNSLSKAKEIFKNAWFKVEIIENDANYGVAKGNNIGIYAALKDNCDYVLLSNNDVSLNDNTIEDLLAGMLRENSTLAVPKIYYWGTNKIWAAGGKLLYWRGAQVIHTGVDEIDNGQYDKITFHDYAATCFMLIAKEVFDNGIFMDEKFFVYWDDTDFVYRAIKKKFKLVYIPTSVVYHKESTCTSSVGNNFKTYYIYRNLAYFTIKNFSLFYFFFISAHIASILLRELFKTPNVKIWRLKWRAYFHGTLLYIFNYKGKL